MIFTNKLKRFADKYPMIFLLLILVFSLVFTEINLTPFFINYVDDQSASYITGILLQGLCSIILIAIIANLELLRNAGFTKLREWKQLWLAWPIVILSIIAGWSFFTGTLEIDTSKPHVIVLYLFVYLSTGFFEEILCRGFLTTFMIGKWGMTKKGLYLAVILSSSVFGVIHFVNFFMGRLSLLSVVTQVLYAMFFGVFFAACVLRNNSIWPTIILHAVFDICSDLNAIAVGESFSRISDTNSTLADAFSSIIVTLPLLIYGLFILRKVKPANESSGNVCRQVELTGYTCAK